jgi:hypothetical protein
MGEKTSINADYFQWVLLFIHDQMKNILFTITIRQKTFEDFELDKIKKMLSSVKIQNDGIQAAKGSLKISKWEFLNKKKIAIFFFTKNSIFMEQFFYKISKWRINQNGEFFPNFLRRSIIPLLYFCPMLFIWAFYGRKIKSKWRPNSSWTSKLLYRLKLVNCLKNSKWTKIQYDKFFVKKFMIFWQQDC